MTSRVCSRCTPATEKWATSESAEVAALAEPGADDAGLPGDAAFREAMTAYMRWAVDNVLVYSPVGAVVPAGVRMPRWGWDGLQS